MAEQPRKAPPRKPELVAARENAPWKPTNPPDEIVFALRAFAAGKANDQQQINLLRWIIQDLCATYDRPYRPGEEGRRETDFACGRQYPGQELVKLMNLPIDKLRRPNVD